MPINVIFLAKIVINNHFRIVSNKIQSYHNFFLTFSHEQRLVIKKLYNKKQRYNTDYIIKIS